jgi:hypothetical protein
MPLLQAGVFKHPVAGGLALGKVVGKENGVRCWTLVGRSLGLGSYACCLEHWGWAAIHVVFLWLSYRR